MQMRNINKMVRIPDGHYNQAFVPCGDIADGIDCEREFSENSSNRKTPHETRGMSKLLSFIAKEYVEKEEFCENIPSTDMIVRKLGKLESIIGEDLVEDIEDSVYLYSYELSVHAVLRGMEIAMDIMEGTYS